MPLLAASWIKYVVVVGVVLGALWWVYNEGKTVGRADAAQECREAREADRKQHEAALADAKSRYADQVKRAEAEAWEYWQGKQEREVVTETIEKEVIKYVERESNNDNACQLDADFLRIWNAANQNRDPN